MDSGVFPHLPVTTQPSDLLTHVHIPMPPMESTIDVTGFVSFLSLCPVADC